MLLAVGMRLSNPEIAALLHISRRTVETHVASLLRKFGVAGRLDLVTITSSLAYSGGALQIATPHEPRPTEATAADVTAGRGSLRSAIDDVLGRIIPALGCTPTLDVHGPLDTVPAPIARALLTVLHEALNDAARHVFTTHVEVRVDVDDESVQLVVDDDGIGVHAGAVAETRVSWQRPLG